ncbi:right-handed parallel beta-helix repeat-containing protein, partial [Helicobacter pylori]
VRISKVGMGVVMGQGKSLMISGSSSIEFNGAHGVYAGYMETVKLTGTRIMGEGKGYGVYAMGTGEMTLDGVTVSKVKEGVVMVGGKSLTLNKVEISKVTTGIAMSGSGTLTVSGATEIEFTGGIGVQVGKDVTAKLTETKIVGKDKGYGVYVGGGTVLLEKVRIEGKGKETGLYMTQGAVWLKETTLRNVAKGLTISEGDVRMEGGSVEFTDKYGISVSEGEALLTGVKITGIGNKGTATDTSTGVQVRGGEGTQGTLMLDNVRISEVGIGAYVGEKGLLVMDKGSINFKGDYGIYFDQGYALLNGVHITGSGHQGTGIKVGDGQLLMVDTTLKNVAEGMTISEGGVHMEGGSIEFAREHGILLKQGRTLLTHVSMKYTGDSHNGTFLKVEADSVLDAQGKRVLNTADIKGLGIKMDGQAKASGVYGFV